MGSTLEGVAYGATAAQLCSLPSMTPTPHSHTPTLASMTLTFQALPPHVQLDKVILRFKMLSSLAFLRSLVSHSIQRIDAAMLQTAASQEQRVWRVAE